MCDMGAVMFVVTFMALTMLTMAHNETAERQIVDFRKSNPRIIGVMATSAGKPISLDETVVLNRPLIFNEFFMDTMTHLVRERIPERVVHAKAAGAFGYFEVTHDMSHICKAQIFGQVGQRTPIAARFSPVVVEKGGIDTSRDARGFAVKFYTEEGNFDIVGFNTPMYVYKDPMLFPTFVRAQKRNPATNLIDGNMLWDFLTLRPESFHMFLLVFSDRGIPDGYRHMPGFGIHTYQVINEAGDLHFIRFHFYPDDGIKNLQSSSARFIAARDPDYAIRDLYNAIGSGNFPSWTVHVQVLSYNDIKEAGFDVFDVTKVLPVEKYPLRPLGKMILNRNPTNYFAEIEQLAFSPANLVPGILGSPDKVFEARRFAYRDAQNYRLGGNFNKIPINCPLQEKLYTYNRDGVPPVGGNQKDYPNYYPNTFNGAVPYTEKNPVQLIEVEQDDANNIAQARTLFTNELSSEERTRLVENVVDSLYLATKELKHKAVQIFIDIHPELGEVIERNLELNISSTSSRNNRGPFKRGYLPSNGTLKVLRYGHLDYQNNDY